ncbi:MAG TPA: hypothetical protein GX707_19495 [Epulopiscium sp.]|nr:hypothetical protein [Candidatus Epulonipiscium sp.]
MCGKLGVDKIFSDGLVLQRNTKNKIYGHDIPNQKMTVSINNIDYNTCADETGYWEVILDEQENSGPFEMSIQGSTQEIIRDLYFGEVFLLAGQSNMELPISRVFDLYEKELSNDLNSNSTRVIHQFTMPKEPVFKGENRGIASGEWVGLESSTMETFSAIGYFFAKHFQSYDQGLNIGLIQAAVGGSPIEAWCNETLIKKYRKNHLKELEDCHRENYVQEKIKIDEKNITNWTENLLEEDILKDAFLEEGFSSDPYPNKITIPTKYDQVEKLKNISGIVWLQKPLNLRSDIIMKMNQEEVYLHLGTIVDADEVWVNGLKVGSTAYQYPPRKYTIPSGLLKEGRNTIMIKHYIHDGKGEFTPTKPYHIITKSKNMRIPLRDEWYYKIGAITKPQPARTFFTNKPTGLYYAMIDPLKKLKLKGVLWYQGESNVEDSEGYGKLFQEMIKLFRKDFESENLPFAFVQLANYGAPEIAGSPGPSAILRKEQEEGLMLDGTAMVVSIDKGEAFDIHPLQKKILGQRLATSMQCLISNQSEMYKGPLLKTVDEKDNKCILKFDNVGEGMKIKSPIYFSLYCDIEKSGADKKIKKWIPVKGILMGKDEISIDLPEQVVRTYDISYAHLDNPRYAALYNSEEFPAKPFIHTFNHN